MSYADTDLAIVPAAAPTRKNQRATSCPAPISAKTPYQSGLRLTERAFLAVLAKRSPDCSLSLPACEFFFVVHCLREEGREGGREGGREDVGGRREVREREKKKKGRKKMRGTFRERKKVIWPSMGSLAPTPPLVSSRFAVSASISPRGCRITVETARLKETTHVADDAGSGGAASGAGHCCRRRRRHERRHRWRRRRRTKTARASAPGRGTRKRFSTSPSGRRGDGRDGARAERERRGSAPRGEGGGRR